MKSRKIKRNFALGIMIFLLLFLMFALFRFINAFFGALIFYMLFSPLQRYLTQKKGLNKHFSAILILISSLFIILIPLIILFGLVTNEILNSTNNLNVIPFITDLINYIKELFPWLDLNLILQNQINSLSNLLKTFFLNVLNTFSHFIINIIILYFVLYYLLIYDKYVLRKIIEFFPFNKKNTKKFIYDFKNLTYSSIITSGIIAIIQGSLLGLMFFIFKIHNPIFWGFIGTILSFFPVVGTPLIWVPVFIMKILFKDYLVGIGILLFGIFISIIDNFIRPYLQKKFGKIHPLVTLVGIFIGVPVFGLIGIIMGPLLISYVFLIIKLFKEEYINK